MFIWWIYIEAGIFFRTCTLTAVFVLREKWNRLLGCCFMFWEKYLKILLVRYTEGILGNILCEASLFKQYCEKEFCRVKEYLQSCRGILWGSTSREILRGKYFERYCEVILPERYCEGILPERYCEVKYTFRDTVREYFQRDTVREYFQRDTAR